MNARHFQQALERRLLIEREERVLTTHGALLPKGGEGRTTDGTDEDRRTFRSDRLRQRRELVASLVARGMTTGEIARKLNVDRRTVVAARSAFEVRP